MILKFAGTDLTTLGIKGQVASGVWDAPPVRGKNLLLPYSPGGRWAQKYYDERPVSVTGFLGGKSWSDTASKVNALKQLFALGSGEQKLEVEQPDGSFRYILAEPRNIILPLDKAQAMQGSLFSIELVASDPFWYGSALEASQARQAWAFDSGVLFDDGAHWFDVTSQYFARTLTSSPVSVEASNAGDYFTRKPVFYLTGAMVNPSIKNLLNGYSIGITVTTVAGDALVIDCGARTVTKNGGALAPSLIALGAGQVDWMHLEAGENTLQIALNQPNPSVAYSAQYSPAYL